MITAVDSSVLLDVFLQHPLRARASARAIEKCGEEGDVVVCDVAVVEVVPGLGRVDDPAAALRTYGVRFDPVGEQTAVYAGKLHAEYGRRRRSQPGFVPDLLIGAHALIQADRLLTRDRGFYRDYFRGLRVVEPE
jgi:hypothetical protein